MLAMCTSFIQSMWCPRFPCSLTLVTAGSEQKENFPIRIRRYVTNITKKNGPFFRHASLLEGNYSSIGKIIIVIYLKRALYSTLKNLTIPTFPPCIGPAWSHFHPADINDHPLLLPYSSNLLGCPVFVILSAALYLVELNCFIPKGEGGSSRRSLFPFILLH